MMKNENKRRQKQFCYDYAMLTIFASYFAKEEMVSQRIRTLQLYYREMAVDEQCKVEQQCERYIQEYVLPFVPRVFFEQKISVSAVYIPELDRNRLEFLMGTRKIQMFVILPEHGKKLQVLHRVQHLA